MTIWPDTYVDVLEHGKRLGEMPLMATLASTPSEKRPPRLRDEIVRIVALTDGKVWEHSDWVVLDETIERHVRLLFSAIADIHLLPEDPLRAREWKEQHRLENHVVPIVQGDDALRTLKRLPRSGNMDPEHFRDEHLGEVGMKVYEKTRSLIYQKLAEAWAKAETDLVAQRFFRPLVMSGAYNELAVKAVLQWNEKASTARLAYTLQQLKADKTYLTHSPPGGNELFRLLSIRWVRSLGDDRTLLLANLNDVLGENFSPKSVELLVERCKAIKVLEDVAISFMDHERPYPRSWQIVSINLDKQEVMLSRAVEQPWDEGRLASEIRELKQKVLSWQNPQTNVRLIVTLRDDRHGGNPQLVKLQSKR